MWDTTNLNLFPTSGKRHVERCGIPHLAKNERDMGHPMIRGRVKTGWVTVPKGRLRVAQNWAIWGKSKSVPPRDGLSPQLRPVPAPMQITYGA
jgi:hypothetical protein